jgi:hypothetical protein
MHIEIVRHIKLTESEDELQNRGYNEYVPLDQRQSHNPPSGFLWTHCESSVYWDTEILESKSI